MASVYILFSKIRDMYYVGSCLELSERIIQHKEKSFSKSYTAQASDWELYYHMDGLGYHQAREIERQIKKMKSKIYIKNLKKYPEISHRLIEKFKNKGSSR